MRVKGKSTIYYVGWNDKGFVCEQPFFTKKAAVAHGVECDREGNGIFLVEVPAKIIWAIYHKIRWGSPH